MKIKTGEHLTNALICITIIGGPITYFVQTEYAKRFRYGLKTYLRPLSKKALLEAIKIVKNLPKEKQDALLNLAVKHATSTSKTIAKKLHFDLEINEKDVKKLIKVGANKITKIIDKL